MTKLNTEGITMKHLLNTSIALFTVCILSAMGSLGCDDSRLDRELIQLKQAAYLAAERCGTGPKTPTLFKDETSLAEKCGTGPKTPTLFKDETSLAV
jgi:hypothetical protein